MKKFSAEQIRKSMLLYAVTCDTPTNISSLADDVKEALAGGATFLQLRLKSADRNAMIEAGRIFSKIAEEYGVPFVIDDDAYAAAACGCDGVHVGQSDMEAANARAIIGPDKILGVSVQTVQQAVAAEKAGADYIGVGAVFPTETKIDADNISKDELSEICRSVSIPVVAIGGISVKNMRQLTGSGISGSAVVSALFGQKNVRAAARELLLHSMLTTMKSAIFDLDGTLLDSMSVWSHVGLDYLESKGIDPKPDTWSRLLPMTMTQSAEYFKNEYGIQKTIEEIIAEVNLVPQAAYENRVQFKQYAKEFLLSLKKLGIPMCIATATDRILVESALKRLDVLDLFEFIITSSEYGSGKEKPGIFEYAMNRLGGNKSNTVIFEDAWHAISTAHSAGFRVIALQDDSASPSRDKIITTSDAYLESFEKILI